MTSWRNSASADREPVLLVLLFSWIENTQLTIGIRAPINISHLILILMVFHSKRTRDIKIYVS